MTAETDTHDNHKETNNFDNKKVLTKNKRSYVFSDGI